MNKQMRILGICLVVLGVAFFLVLEPVFFVLGIIFLFYGIFQIRKHPKANDFGSSVSLTEKDYEAMNQFLSPLSSVPRYPITASGEYVLPLSAKDLSSFSHTNITRSTPSDRYFRFVSIDVETTGLDSDSEIIEISAVKWIGREPVEVFSTLCKSNNPIPLEASRINHITNDMVSDAPYFYKILPDLQNFISDFAIVGHNIDFDLKFLQRYGLDLSGKRFVFDTLDLSRKSIKKETERSHGYDRISDYKLETVRRFFNINVPVMHRSLCDAYATSLIFFQLIARIVG